jgi:hypothetical protein
MKIVVKNPGCIAGYSDEDDVSNIQVAAETGKETPAHRENSKKACIDKDVQVALENECTDQSDEENGYPFITFFLHTSIILPSLTDTFSCETFWSENQYQNPDC